MKLEDYIWDRDEGICVYCRDAIGQELEHVVPEGMGGPTIRGNIVLSCRSCNIKKIRNLDRFLPIAMRYLISKGESIDWLLERTERIEIDNQKQADLLQMDIEDGFDEDTALEEASEELDIALQDLEGLSDYLETVIEDFQNLGTSLHYDHNQTQRWLHRSLADVKSALSQFQRLQDTPVGLPGWPKSHVRERAESGEPRRSGSPLGPKVRPS